MFLCDIFYDILYDILCDILLTLDAPVPVIIMLLNTL